ncbi:MAG: tetratricopeptide repeat protein [Myxococcota bacterium]
MTRNRLPAGIWLAALAIRLGYLWLAHDAVWFEPLQTQPLRYDGWARAILAGDAPFRPPFDEAPAYVYLVALVYAVAGPSALAVTTVQAALDAGSCAAIAVVARRLAGPVAGVAAGTIAVVAGPLVYFVGQLEPATLAVAAVAAALAATPGLDPDDVDVRPWRWWLCGLGWAAAVAVRSELALAWPIVAVHAARTGSGRDVGRALGAPTGLLGLSLVVNTAASGHLVPLTTGAGINLWLGNNPLADGVSPFVSGPRAAALDAITADAIDPVDADRRFVRAVAAFVRDDPAAWLRLVARKAAWTVTDRELPNAADIGWQTASIPGFSLLPGTGLLVPVAVAGWALLPADRRRRATVLAAPIAVAVVVSVVFFANARFRLVWIPSLAVLGGVAIARAAEIRGPPVDPRGARLGGLALIAGWLVVHHDIDGVHPYRIPELDLNTAALALADGDPDQALALIDGAVAANPGDPAGWVRAAELRERLGDVRGAAMVWDRAVEALPDEPRVRAGAAGFARRTRR